MAYTAEERGMIWLCACGGFDERMRVSLLRAAKDPALLIPDLEKFLPSVVEKGDGRLYKSDRTTREREADELIGKLDRKGYFAVTIVSDDYPEPLKHISGPPLVLYGAGNRSLLKTQMFCVVGSRIIPPWAAKQGKIIAGELSRKFTVVTGLAEGGDSAAIEGAIDSGNLICVLPNGLDECYPAAHASLKERVRSAGLLLSEYLPEEGAKKYSFYARNRILAGLSKGVLVLSAGKRSGTSITANCALDYGREVFAFPHNLGATYGEGCNELIKKGAYLVSGIGDIFSVFGIEEEKKEDLGLSPEEEKMLSALRNMGEAHVAELAETSGIPVYEAAAPLSALEMKNLAAKAGGNRYSAV